MSGIIGSRLNTRGSGLTGSLGTDGQVLTSAGAGLSVVHENVAGGGGKVLQVITDTTTTEMSTASTGWIDADLTVAITPASANSKILVLLSTATKAYTHSVFTGMGIDRNGGASGDGILGGQSWGLTRNHFAWSESYPSANTSKPDINSAHASYVDSPGVTSEVTYKFRFKSTYGTCYVQAGGILSSLVLMEIGA